MVLEAIRSLAKSLTDGMKKLIQVRAKMEDVRDQALTDGMTTLKQDGIMKTFQGLTDMKEVRRVCIT